MGVSPLWYNSLVASEIFPPEQLAAWRELVRTPPESLGVERSRWTLATLQQVEPVWASYTLSGLWRLLRALKIRYKRGRH
jgi:transposase